MYDNVDLSDYPKVKNIICKVHGEFDCNIRTHVEGNGGCKKCQYEKLSHINAMTEKDVITKLEKGRKLVRLNNSKDIILECEEHGEYKSNNEALYRKNQGCTKCTEEDRHNQSLYYYCNLIQEIYPSMKIEVKGGIISCYCDEHNTETKLSVSTAAGKTSSGVLICKRCSRELKSSNNRTDRGDFITASINKYGDIFDYSKMKYVNNNTKITLTCKQHGDFTVYPVNHARGVLGGCKVCQSNNARVTCWKNVRNALDGGYAEKDTYFYVVKFSDPTEEFYKVGVARNGVKQRYSGSRYNHFTIDYILEKRISEFKAVLLEHFLLYNFNRYEPITKFAGHTECFKEINSNMWEVINKYTIQERKEDG